MASDKKSVGGWARPWSSKMKAAFRWFRLSKPRGRHAVKRRLFAPSSRITSGSTRLGPWRLHRVAGRSACSANCGAARSPARSFAPSWRSSCVPSQDRLFWSGTTIRSTGASWLRPSSQPTRACMFFISRRMRPNSIQWKAFGLNPKTPPPAVHLTTFGSFIGMSIRSSSALPILNDVSGPAFASPSCPGLDQRDNPRHCSLNDQ